MAGNWWRLYPPKRMKRALDAALRFDDEGGAASLIHQARMTLDNDQIKALPGEGEGSYIDLAGAPGLERAVLVQWMTLVADTRAGAYAMDGALYFGLVNETDMEDIFNATNLFESSAQSYPSLADGQAERIITVLHNEQGKGQWGQVSSEEVNRGLVLALTGESTVAAITDGHSSNTVAAILLFYVLDLSIGLFLTTTESGWDQDTRTFS